MRLRRESRGRYGSLFQSGPRSPRSRNPSIEPSSRRHSRSPSAVIDPRDRRLEQMDGPQTGGWSRKGATSPNPPQPQGNAPPDPPESTAASVRSRPESAQFTSSGTLTHHLNETYRLSGVIPNPLLFAEPEDLHPSKEKRLLTGCCTFSFTSHPADSCTRHRWTWVSAISSAKSAA